MIANSLNSNVIIKKIYLFLLFFALQKSQCEYTIETIYGSMIIKDQATMDILSSQPMQRLKNINQYGVWPFIKKQPSYTRYTHSVGVYFLAKKFNASYDEALFCLLHDISHTVFSHVADFIFNTTTRSKSHQDEVLVWFVNQTDLREILEQHQLLHILDDETIQNFRMFKIPLPDLCLDRLEYNLYGGLVEGWLTEHEIRTIVDDLIYVNGNFVFQTAEHAKKLADISIQLSLDNWCNPAYCFLYQQTADMISYALQKKIITLNDFYFSDDQTVWNTLHACNDAYIQATLADIKQYNSKFSFTTPENADLAVQNKFKGINPLVMTYNGIKRLSEIDADFADFFYHSKEQCSRTFYLQKVV